MILSSFRDITQRHVTFFSCSKFLCGQKRCIDSDEFVHNKTHNLHGMAGLPRFISAQTFYTLYNNYFNKFSMNP